MKPSEYVKGLHHLGNGVYAYLLPDGSWGLNNAGLVVSGDESLLIDTLFDIEHTREMLSEMAAATPAARVINTLAITHGNGDHFYGSQLVKGARVIASKKCAEEMEKSPPETLAALLEMAPQLGEAGEFVSQMFGRFKFKGLSPLPVTLTFDKYLDFDLGNKRIRLMEVGPAHTRGDTLVYVPGDKTIFAGDILFIGGTPVIWAGPMKNWIDACDMMLDMDVSTFVPGHGPVTDKKGVEAVKGYLEFIYNETRKRYEDGMAEDEAVSDIDLGPYKSLGDRERIIINVNTLYREFSESNSPPDVMDLFSRMSGLA
jgi:cyclase